MDGCGWKIIEIFDSKWSLRTWSCDGDSWVKNLPSEADDK